MEEPLFFGDITIRPEYTEREINFTILTAEGYQYRLVPGLNGFELSALDKCLGAEPDKLLVDHLSQYITNFYA